jgi:hypothetical protein
VKTLHYTRDHVAVMVKTALHFAPVALVRSTGENPARLRRMAAARLRPTPAVIRYFDLTLEGGGYSWTVR